jgi:hypothetical protein
MRHKLTDTELRTLDGCKVSMHPVLTGKFKGYFAIIPKPGATVLGYTQRGILTDCVTKISRNAQAKVHAGGNRSVHAWILGTFRYISDDPCPMWKGTHYSNELHYNPTKGDQGFMLHARLIKDRPTEPITTAERIIFWHKQIFLLKSAQVEDFFERRGEL